jgi:hypothetical protein
MRIPDSIDFFQVLSFQAVTVELYTALDSQLREKASDRLSVELEDFASSSQDSSLDRVGRFVR